jgi:hypothetical protein
MAATPAIKAQILEAIFTALGAASSIGQVVDLGELDEAGISATIAGGEHVAELVCTDDEPWTAAEVMGKEGWTFDVFVLLHLAALKDDDGAPIRPSVTAAGAHAAVYATYATPGNPELDGTWGGLAVETECLGGGSVAIDPQLGTRQGFSAFRVKYRHKYGDMTSG